MKGPFNIKIIIKYIILAHQARRAAAEATCYSLLATPTVIIVNLNVTHGFLNFLSIDPNKRRKMTKDTVFPVKLSQENSQS
jgi:hypothetical protein